MNALAHLNLPAASFKCIRYFAHPCVRLKQCSADVTSAGVTPPPSEFGRTDVIIS